MSEVNWNDNAKEAVEKFYEYLDEQGMHYANSSACIADFFEWLTSTQTKTVADAVEWHKSKGWGLSWASKAKDCITHGKLGFAFADSRNIQLDRKLVCTRAEFEAYVKEQEGEKWTHTYTDDTGTDIRCRLLAEHGEWAWIEDAGTVDTISKSWLKPIKPTLTKAEAWNMLMKRKTNSAEVNTIKQQYDII